MFHPISFIIARYNDNQISLYISEDNAIMYETQAQTTYKYRYMSPTKVQEDYGKEDGRAGIFLYQEDPNYGVLFWLYNVDGEIYLRENVSNIKLTYIPND